MQQQAAREAAPGCELCAANREMLERTWKTASASFYDPAGRFSQARWAQQLLDTLQARRGTAGPAPHLHAAAAPNWGSAARHTFACPPALSVQGAGGVLQTRQQTYNALQAMVATLHDPCAALGIAACLHRPTLPLAAAVATDCWPHKPRRRQQAPHTCLPPGLLAAATRVSCRRQPSERPCMRPPQPSASAWLLSMWALVWY